MKGMSSQRSKRRDFLKSAAALTVVPSLASTDMQNQSGSITQVDGIKVGHYTDKRRPTGCTVLIFEGGAVAGVDVRGSAPGTRETDLLNPINTVQKINAIVLSGGSAFGLAAATGAVRYLEEKGMGFPVGPLVVPIVPAAILFDLGLGDAKIRPDADAGYAACQAASNGLVAEGNVGAGAGATIGKLFGMKTAMKSGLGSTSIKVGDSGLVVGALVAVNAVGDVRDPETGRIIAGARHPNGDGFVDAVSQIMKGQGVQAKTGTNTTIGVVATNAVFDKAQATKIAQMAHDGLARAISPVHSPYDGDTIFSVCTGTSNVKADTGAIGAIAAKMMEQAVLRAVRAASGLPGLPAYADMQHASKSGS
jgi:L-aminopeptidase/D-esterase-like protein